MIIIKKRFRSKKRIKIKFNLFKVIVFILIIYLSFLITYKVLFKIRIQDKLSDERVIKYLLASGTNNNIKNSNSLTNLLNSNLANPSSLFKYSFNNMFKGIDNSIYTFREDEEESEVDTEYIADPDPKEVKDPIVYIYNTHQRENYNIENLEPYNIKPNVLMASYILREKLNDLGIPTLVETNDITEILRINNWKYSYSYEASEILMKDALEKNKSLVYLIDLHRDSISYEKTTVEIANEKYAKILFVVGKEHEGYEQNLALANKLNAIIQTDYPTLTRGIYVKEGPGVDGIYNQNISPNTMLIEVGGPYNSIEEVNNTIPIIAKSLYKIIKEGK